MINKLKSLANNAMNHKELIRAEFDNYSEKIIKTIEFKEEFLKNFMEQNKDILEKEELNPFEIQNAFDEAYSETIDPHQYESIALIFALRDKIIFLKEEDKDWFVDLYKQSRTKIYTHVSEVYLTYLQKIKEECLNKELSTAFKRFMQQHLTSFSYDEDDESEEESLLEKLKKNIKGGIQ